MRPSANSLAKNVHSTLKSMLDFIIEGPDYTLTRIGYEHEFGEKDVHAVALFCYKRYLTALYTAEER